MEQFIYRIENLSTDESGRKQVVIDGDEQFHLSRVLRVRTGEKILATDGNGSTLLCSVLKISRDAAVCDVLEEYRDMNRAPREYLIGIALLRPMSKMELALEKCTELGAGGFILFDSERSDRVRPRLERLEGIIRSAVKQSLRSRIPRLQYVESLSKAVEGSAHFEEKIVLHEKSKDSLAARLQATAEKKSVAALVGPEGGFSENEVEFLAGMGYISLSLGSARLRSETAAIAVSSVLSEY